MNLYKHLEKVFQIIDMRLSEVMEEISMIKSEIISFDENRFDKL